MKSKITKIMGIVLSLVLLSSLAIMVTPVSAAIGTNAFGLVTPPTIDPVSAVDQMEIAPNGDLYASVGHLDGSDELWTLYKSVDGGKTWNPTALKSTKIGANVRITAVAAAPDSEMIYVAVAPISTSDMARVWKCPNGAEDDPFPLQALIDSSATEVADYIYDLEVWSDGTTNWVMAGTDLDVMVLRDGLFEPWRDMDLSSSFGVDDDIAA